MRKKKIQELIDSVEKIHGSISLYGSDPLEKYGTCFTLKDTKATTFSIIMNRKKAERGTFSIQIENHESQLYIYYLDKCSLEHFLELVDVFKKPMKHWPM